MNAGNLEHESAFILVPSLLAFPCSHPPACLRPASSGHVSGKTGAAGPSVSCRAALAPVLPAPKLRIPETPFLCSAEPLLPRCGWGMAALRVFVLHDPRPGVQSPQSRLGVHACWEHRGTHPASPGALGEVAGIGSQPQGGGAISRAFL